MKAVGAVLYETSSTFEDTIWGMKFGDCSLHANRKFLCYTRKLYERFFPSSSWNGTCYFQVQMLSHMSISNTYIYSDLDPTARKINLAKFQNGIVSALIVTDVAARGIDIPQLDYVINYDFPAKPKLFVHRVGEFCCLKYRTGWAWSGYMPRISSTVHTFFISRSLCKSWSQRTRI